ncbi:MAG: TetR/AcrR family transcriptional regulator [Thermoleophilaceae bacterium]
MERPPTREERQAQTRALLVQAAARLFAREGYHRATLAGVAREAGFSTGAVYSNFAGKDDLFLAVYEMFIAGSAREVDLASAEEAAAHEQARHAADQWMDRLARHPEGFLLFVELWLQALRDPARRADFGLRFAVMRDAVTRIVEHLADRHDLDLPMPAGRLAVGLRAFANGMALEKLADPDGVPDEIYGEIVALLFRSFESTPGNGDRSATTEA